MTCLQHAVGKNHGLVCKTCRYSASFKAGECSYGTPICPHDNRLKCRYEEAIDEGEYLHWLEKEEAKE